MTVYNFNQGIGWASSGVEYAQAYRAQVFHHLGVDAKFIFTDFISAQNIEHYTANLGFKDEEVIWLYQAFSDFKIAPTTYTLADLTATFAEQPMKVERQGNVVTYIFNDQYYVRAFLRQGGSGQVLRAEYVRSGNLFHRDFFSYGRYMSEYYAPIDGKAKLMVRRFFNEDGSVAMEELPTGDNATFRLPGQLVLSKEELITALLERLAFQKGDVIIIDRGTGMAQQILAHKGPAKVGSVVHAEHFSVNNTNDDHILWNNYYEYAFQHHRDIDFYVTSTQVQTDLLASQFAKYNQAHPQIFTIPVGSLLELKHPTTARRPFSLITASRLAGEKHLDWVVQAVMAAKAQFPQLTLDIYGEGGERAKLQQLIKDGQAEDYIHLKGHQNLTDVYQGYQAYISASTSEGFGLTLLEAVGSGLAMIGFDVRYGNQTFIRNDENGYLIPYEIGETGEQAIHALTTTLAALFAKLDLERAEQVSYDLAADYLEPEIEAKWAQLLKEVQADD